MQWIEPDDYDIPEDFTQSIGGNPLVAHMLYRLGISEIATAQEFLDDSLYHPSPPTELPELDKSADYLIDIIRKKKRITVWGDFDVDGQTSTTILVSVLRKLGAVVDYHIPVRASESHGINLPVLKQLIKSGTQILLTCDTGISALTEVAFAQKKGVPVIITDHHDLPAELPEAFSVINPKLLPANHPLGDLPGVGVAYQLITHLCNLLDREELSRACLDLVALGIVADMAMIKADTRWLLQQGLKVLRNTHRIGLKLLYEMIEINPENISEEHIGFYLAPRLNALGRLADANKIVEFFTTTDTNKAKLLAIELEGVNAQRKLMTDQVFQAAQTQIENNPKLLDDGVIFLSNPNWPAGVIGIVASRLVERYNLPTILLSTPPGQIARGSARSVEGVNINALIAANQHFLTSFGGHPMAAGLSIEISKIPEFHHSLIKTVQLTMKEKQRVATLQIGGYYQLSDLNLELVDQIERLAPFGPGNPPPLLATRQLSLLGYTSVGRSSEHLLLTVEDESGFEQKVIWWQGAGWPVPQSQFDLAYTVRASTFHGQRDIQVEWVDYRIIEKSTAQFISSPRQIQIVDYRWETDPISILESHVKQDSRQVWCESATKYTLPYANRYALTPSCTVLEILTIPPGPVELKAVIEKTSPEKIYMYGINPEVDQPNAFLRHLAGLIKFAIKNYSGNIKLSTLAAASSHRIRTIRAGIAWFEAHGHVSITEQDGDNWVIESANHSTTEKAYQTSLNLKELLDETRAYRNYYLITDPNTLINL